MGFLGEEFSWRDFKILDGFFRTGELVGRVEFVLLSTNSAHFGEVLYNMNMRTYGSYKERERERGRGVLDEGEHEDGAEEEGNKWWGYRYVGG